MRVGRKVAKCISVLLTLTFITGQVLAGQLSFSSSNSTLATPNVSGGIDPTSSRQVKEDVGGTGHPGAIANGQYLIDLLDPNKPLPTRIEATKNIDQVLRNAVKYAHRLLANSYAKIAQANADGKLTDADVSRLQSTQNELLNFWFNFTQKLWLYHLEVSDPENYRAGFNRDEVINGKQVRAIGLALEVIERILVEFADEPEMAQRLIAQYITHESIPENEVILPQGYKDLPADEFDQLLRSDHRAVYNNLQAFLYGKEEVAALKRIIRASINAKLEPVKVVPTAINLKQLPVAFQENFGRYGLAMEGMEVVEIVDGQPRALAAGENPIQNSVRSQMIIGTTLLQALQASQYIGMAQTLGMSGDDFGKLADGAAVTVGRKALEFLAKAYDVTIVIAGNEGKTRDGAPAMSLGSVINPEGKNGTYLYIGDSIEVTNGVKAGGNGSSSMMALLPVSVKFETDGYKISLWTDFSHIDNLDPVIAGENSLESVLTRLAESKGLSMQDLTKQYDIMTLDRHKNDDLKAQAEALGFKVLLKKDGDPVPGIRAMYGIPDAKGKKLIVLSTGGANEHYMAQIAATLYGQSAMATIYASTVSLKSEDKKETGSLRPARDWTEKDLKEFSAVNTSIAQVNSELGLNIPLLPQTPEELTRHVEDERTLAEQLRGNAAIGITSISGAPVIDMGISAPYLSPTTYYNSKDGKEMVRISGFFVNEEGRLFLYKSTMQSNNMSKTRASLTADNDFGLTPAIQETISQSLPVISTESGQKYSIVQGVAAQSIGELLSNIRDSVRINKSSVTITDRTKFIHETVDYLAYESALSQNADVKAAAQRILREAAISFNVKLASINDFYMAKQEGKWSNITVPAVNGRADVYNQYQQLFRVAKEKDIGAIIMELARSEMRYSDQDPSEFTAIGIASAIKQGYEGLIFAQGDHFQVAKAKYEDESMRENELRSIEDLIRKSVLAGMYNIDLDASTLVDSKAMDKILEIQKDYLGRYLQANPDLLKGLDENGVKALQRKLVDEIEMGEIEFLTESERIQIRELYQEMHKTNAEVTMRFIRYIRSLERELGITKPISIGIEERHIDDPKHKNNPSTVLGSMTLSQTILKICKEEGLVGPSKMSLQTGAMHGVGGEVDFGIFKRHLKYAKEIGIAVFVQHGASTLMKEDFDKMRDGDVGEVHLATEYQKIELDVVSRLLPKLGEAMERYLAGLMGKDAGMKKKFLAMWNLAFGNATLAIESIAPDDKEREAKEKTFSALAETQSRKSKTEVINEIFGDSMPKGLKGKLKDLVKELPGPFKRQLMNLIPEVRMAVDRALYEEFSMILSKLGAENTKSIVRGILPFDEQPVNMPARPKALEKAVEAANYTKTVESSSQVMAAEKPEPQTEEAWFNAIAGELDGRAHMLKQCLDNVSANIPEKRVGVLFFEKGIGENQSAKTQRLYNVLRMVDPRTGEPLFSNINIIEDTAEKGVEKIQELRKAGLLDESKIFIIGRESSTNEFLKLRDIKTWVALLKDNNAGDYEPIPEAAILLMMAALKMDERAIEKFYNEISQTPMSVGDLQRLLNVGVVIIIPKTTKFSEQADYQKELYDLAAEALTRA